MELLSSFVIAWGENICLFVLCIEVYVNGISTLVMEPSRNQARSSENSKTSDFKNLVPNQILVPHAAIIV